MKMTTRHGLALVSTLLITAACDQAQDLGDGSDPASMLPEGGSPVNGSSSGSAAADASTARDAPYVDAALDSSPSDAGQSSSCAGNAPCDPLANSGCAASQTCLVSWTGGTSTASCKPTISQSSQVFGKACPCAAGLTCFSEVGLCYRVCDYTHGTPLLDKFGKPIANAMKDNPECLADPEAERNGYTVCHKIGSCFGVCDVLATLP